MEDIILLGIGGHAHSVVDSIEAAEKYHIIGFLDVKEKQGKSFRGYQVLGEDVQMARYYSEGVRNAFISIGYMGHGMLRETLYGALKKIGYSIPNIIDPSAIVARDVLMGEGIFVGKRAVINVAVSVGDMCIINTGAVLEHDCCVGRFSHIAVGSVLCGGVHVGERTLIGANATIIQELRIGNECIVGAGTTIRRNIEDNYMARCKDEIRAGLR